MKEYSKELPCDFGGEPDSTKAATIGVDIIDEYNVESFNVQIKHFISKLPGINSKNLLIQEHSRCD